MFSLLCIVCKYADYNENNNYNVRVQELNLKKIYNIFLIFLRIVIPWGKEFVKCKEVLKINTP